MAGQPYAKRNAGKRRGQIAQEQRDAVLNPENGGGLENSEDSINPVLLAYQQRKEAVLQKVKADRERWIKERGEIATQDQIDQVIELMCNGYNVKEACEMLEASYPAINKAIYRNPETRQRVEDAREMYAYCRVQTMYEVIATEPDPARARILADAVKWEVSKVLPKFYGDRIDVTASDKVTFSINLGAPADK